MVVKEFDYVNGNAALQPKRKIDEKERKKYEELKKSKKNRQRRLLDEKKKNRKAIGQIALFILFMGILSISRDAQVFSSQNELRDINREIKLITAENEALHVDLIKYASLDSIKATAENSLGMVSATRDNVVEIDLSENYFASLEEKEALEAKEEERGILAKVKDALGF